MYQADLISSFFKRNSEPYYEITPSIIEPLWTQFSYEKPLDLHSEWVKEMLRCGAENGVRRLTCGDGNIELESDYEENEYWTCYGSLCHFWGIQQTIDQEQQPIGHTFTCNSYHNVDYECDDEMCTWYQCDQEILYRFDSYVDFQQACHDLHQHLQWLRNEVYLISESDLKSGLVKEFKNISDMQYRTFLSQLKKTETQYESIFPLCAQNHHAPSAFYHMTLHHFQSGDHLRALEALRKVFDLIDPNSLEVHLASQIALSSGQIKNEIGFFDEAILSLQQALDYNPQNKEAYLEKAIAYFEKGEYSQSISDYLASDYKFKPVTPNMVEFSSGLIKGIICGGTKSLANFLPSTLASLYGLGHGIWAFACSPREVSLEMVETCCAISDFLFTHSSLETVQVLIPELKEFSHDLSDHRKGEVIGTIIGKYGVDFFAFAGLVKGVKLYRNLKKANEALTLHSLASFEKGQKIRQVSQSWWKNTAPIVEKIRTGRGRVGDQLYKAFRNQNLSELQVRKILHGAGFKTFPKPKGIPSSSTVKISKNGGGMVYVKAGITSEESILIRVMPGNPKSPNPLQQKPYVVQRRRKKAVAKSGKLIDPDSTEAHIPLEEFEFKGW